MASDDPEELRELFSAFGPVSVRRMFGGAGIFAAGILFGLVLDGEIFLKADAETLPALQAEGAKPFIYRAKGKRVSLSYWRAPERLQDDADDLARFARAALAAAHRVRHRKSGARRKMKR